MRPEIGSDYWLSKGDYDNALSSRSVVDLPVSFSSVTLTNLCRTGIELFLDKLNVVRRIVLLPEFTCHSVVDPFIHHGYDVHCYKLNLDFSIDYSAFISQIESIKPAIILLHSYFGFDTIPSDVKSISPNSIIIEDLTQRFMSSFPLIDADCYVGSIRKWMPVPDGGFYYGSEELDLSENEDKEFVDLELKALLCKGEYIEGEIDDKMLFRNMFSAARKLMDEDGRYYSMSAISKQIYNSIDFEAVKTIRQANGRYLVKELSNFDFLEIPMNEISNDTIPFLIPVYVKEDRSNFQKYLASKDVYATVIWSCPNEILDQLSVTGRYIYDNILCFHCDQRYGLDDMERIIDVIKGYNA